MNRFIGRKRELKALNELYDMQGFRMTVVYGRRRIGKSSLIKEFIKDKRCLYYEAIRAGIERNVELWGAAALSALAPDLRGLSFADAGRLLDFIGAQCTAERTVIVIDELPYICEADRSFLSLLQSKIDNQWADSNIMLILCGSSVSFMEDEVLSSKSPIFGRRDSQIRLEAFDYLQAAEFVPEYSCEEKAICYGITGGVAKYLSLINPSESLDSNIVRLFFNNTGYLYEEANNLLTQEFRNVSLYGDILAAVASGCTKLNEISDRVGCEAASSVYALNALISVGIIGKDTAITDEKNKKKTLYTLKDGMMRFWYSFIPYASQAIAMEKGEQYYFSAVKPRLHEYMGPVFEEMCRNYTLAEGLSGNLPCFVSAVGRWWGTNPDTKEQTDIDVVGLDRQSRRAVLGECKFRNETADKKVLDKLKERNGLISSDYSVCSYILFSKSGFSPWLEEHAEEEQTMLISLEDMYAIGQ